jgi:hypothetical protein
MISLFERDVQRLIIRGYMTTLLLSSRHTEDNQQLWRAAVRRGWNVERVRGLTIPPFQDATVVLYIESLFAPTIAKHFGLRLLQTPLNWLTTLPIEYRHRMVDLTTLEAARKCTFPAFIKPPNEKSFAAQVYDSPDSLPVDYDSRTPVLVASPVEWLVEFRCFCLGANVRTFSPYLRQGRLSKLDNFTASSEELCEAKAFAEKVLGDKRVTVPRAIVLDVGLIKDVGWAVVEANAAWGSGIYGCDPDEVLNVILHATVKSNECSN